MRIKLRRGIRRRREEFGGVCYSPERDDLFALTSATYDLIARVSLEWEPAPPELEEAYAVLAEVGLCDTAEPTTCERPYCGPSLIGEFAELPTIDFPLVVNCFCTAHCHLKCVYCHADDLMYAPEVRGPEDRDEDFGIDNVIATARSIPALVAVVTGGDPLSRPVRAKRIIEGIGDTKAVVVDTSGVGRIEDLLPTLKRYNAHVRVSVDSARRDLNRRMRPANLALTKDRDASWAGAERTIRACLAAGVPLTVQTVVSSRNENEREWEDLRDWLLALGVRNWVMHVAVRGGKARELEERTRGQSRPRSILPSAAVYDRLWQFVKKTIRDDLRIDIRCTDTNQSPNSVLLIASNGDLYTEGYARHGKVKLYSANEGKPDLVQRLMNRHLDRFGHIRRYLNWNPWFFDGKSIEDICVKLPRVSEQLHDAGRSVETEVKCRVLDPDALAARLRLLGFVGDESVLQRDEYFDDSGELAKRTDQVVRLRKDGARSFVAMKGARFYTSDGANSRLEFEVSVEGFEQARGELAEQGLHRTWYFEKRRQTFTRDGDPEVVVVVDEVPDVGWFAEIEGPLEQVRAMKAMLADFLGEVERRNYKDLYLDARVRSSGTEDPIEGAEFRAPPFRP